MKVTVRPGKCKWKGWMLICLKVFLYSVFNEMEDKVLRNFSTHFMKSISVGRYYVPMFSQITQNEFPLFTKKFVSSRERHQFMQHFVHAILFFWEMWFWKHSTCCWLLLNTAGNKISCAWPTWTVYSVIWIYWPCCCYDMDFQKFIKFWSAKFRLSASTYARLHMMSNGTVNVPSVLIQQTSLKV